MDRKPKLTSLGIQCNRDLEDSQNGILKQCTKQINQTAEQISLDFDPVDDCTNGDKEDPDFEPSFSDDSQSDRSSINEK